MTLYTKVTRDKYEFPLAVAESKKELAELLGQPVDSVRSAFSHGQALYHTIIIEDDEMWPDNDGRLWYYNENGEVVYAE